MRINKLQLKNFKRFTDLTLDGIPVSAKLVLLIGANGSGKTSVLEAINNLIYQYTFSLYNQNNEETENQRENCSNFIQKKRCSDWQLLR